MNIQVRVHIMGNRQVKSELEQDGMISVPVILGSNVLQTPPTSWWFRFHDYRDEDSYSVLIRMFSATSFALLHGPNLGLQRYFPLLHSYTDSEFRPCQLLAACAQLKGVVKKHMQQLIICTETQPGDRGKNEHEARFSLEYCCNTRNIFLFPRTSLYVRSNEHVNAALNTSNIIQVFYRKSGKIWGVLKFCSFFSASAALFTIPVWCYAPWFITVWLSW